MWPFVLESPGGFSAPPQPLDWVVYLHGFRSSSRSVKAQKTIDAFAQAGQGDRLWVPDLPASPAQALALVEDELRVRLHNNPRLRLGFMGSSLGGFYATVLGERHLNARVALLNPAVKPYNDLQEQIGRKAVYFSDEEIEFVPAYLDELRAMETTQLTQADRYLLVAATGDEVLSFASMVARYPGAHQLRIQGSDHALSDYDEQLPFVRLFMGLA
ncbi:MAG TPA: YqiA/YcfP family alpha/beta fold hydrolase [Limnobacter sp.]|uniref:YqiA/YcfP family alpha/beta fold hydrolase n=1 Tax=Limnobacter sp. TaxID=2003368 RepID=UPI002EDAC3E2